MVLSAFLYCRGASVSRGIRTWEACCWWAGWVTLALALVSPVHPLGEALFSAHMAQHELLMVIAAPLLVLGRPLVPFVWALPESWRKPVGAPVFNWWKQATRPGPATLIHGVILWGWHLPVLFQSTLTSDVAHTLQHISFLGSALLFWWAMLRGGRHGLATLYVFATTVHTSILGALLTFSSQVWYPAYEGRTAAWNLTALEDQQLGGLIMWVPASITYIAAGLVLIALWMRESEWRVLARESEMGL
jgi:cytochrome c oxidase assembly factor CtaG